MTEPTYPVDSAFGAGHLQIWSAQRAAISASRASRSGPSRPRPHGRVAAVDIKIGALHMRWRG